MAFSWSFEALVYDVCDSQSVNLDSIVNISDTGLIGTMSKIGVS